MSRRNIGGEQELYRGGVGAASGGLGRGLAIGAGASAAVSSGAGGAAVSLLEAVRDAGGEILKVVARDYGAEQRGRIDDILLRTEAEFERWKAEYREKRRGADALGAREDFAAKYEELRQAALKEFGGRRGEVYATELDRELFKRGLYALREGGQYQIAQRDAWNQSLLNGRLAMFEKMCAENPEDGERIELEMADAIAAWRERNPGLDDTELRMKMATLATRTRLDSLIAQGRLDEARNALAGRGLGIGEIEYVSGKSGGRAVTRGMAKETEGLIRDAARRHGVDEELMLATAMQESGGDQSSVSRAGAIGVMQLMPGTAKELGVDPRDLRQNIEGGVRYFAGLLKRYKGDATAALTAYNMGPGGYDAWKSGKRGITKESREYAGRVFGRMRAPGLTPTDKAAYGDKIAAAGEKLDAQTRERAYQGNLGELTALLRGEDGTPAEERRTRIYDWLSRVEDPELRDRLERRAMLQWHYEDRIEAAAEKERARREDAEFAESLSELTNFMRGDADKLPENRKAYVYDWLSRVSDPVRRAKLERAAMEQWNYEDRKGKAKDGAEAMRIYRELASKGAAPNDALIAIAKAPGLSDQARNMAREMVSGGASKTSFANVQALSQGMLAIDKGELRSQEERIVYAVNSQLTPQQWQKLMDYRGNMADVSLARVEAALKACKVKYKDDELFRWYQDVERELPKGRPATTADLHKAVASLVLQGTVPASIWPGISYNADKTYREARDAKQADLWLPTIQPEDKDFLDEILKSQGHKLNDHNRRVALKRYYKRPDANQWDDEE